MGAGGGRVVVAGAGGRGVFIGGSSYLEGRGGKVDAGLGVASYTAGSCPLTAGTAVSYTY